MESQATEICNFGTPSPLDLLNYLQWILSLFSRLFVLVDISNIFYFFLLGGGEGGVRGARKGRGSVFYSKSKGGGGSPTRGGGGGGAGRVSAGNFGWGG